MIQVVQYLYRVCGTPDKGKALASGRFAIITVVIDGGGNKP